MLSKSQTTYHWREWKKTRQRLLNNGYSTADADAERYVIYLQACGKDSIKKLNNKDFDMVLAHFRSISDPGDFDAQMHAEQGTHDRATWSIREAAKTLGDAYIAKVASERFHTSDWRGLTDRQLSQLAMTLNNRLRHRATA